MELTTAEMYSGIGGMRYGLEKANQASRQSLEEKPDGNDLFNRGDSSSFAESREEMGKITHFHCVWANDFDKYACQIYRKHYGTKELVEADIRTIQAENMPDFDLLTAGFPCPSFSLAGKRKGFQDVRGALFYEVVRVARIKRPKLLLLENVKGLLSNDNGKTFGTILEELGNIGYWCEWQVVNSKHFGVPQNRERVFIVGHLRAKPSRQIFPIRENGEGIAGSCGEAQGERSRVRTVNSLNCSGSGKERNSIERKVRVHRDDVKKSEIQGYSFFPEDAEYVDVVDNHPKNILVANTLSHRYGKDGSENLILQMKRTHADGSHMIREYHDEVPTLTQQMGTGGNNVPMVQVQPLAYLGRNQKNYDNEIMLTIDGRQSTGLREGQRIRRLTPTECERLQGFPDRWSEHGLGKDGSTTIISDTQRYKVLGNAVTTNVITYLGKHLSSLFCG